MAPPDADLYPNATGRAAKVVAAHQKEEPLKLYSGWFCPFVQRAWVVLQEKNIPYQYVEVNPYHKEKSFPALNPRGLVPTLACPQEDKSSKPLYESNIICEYLDTISSSPLSLFPKDPYAKARAKIWIDHVTSRIIPAYHRFLQHTAESPYSLSTARDEFHTSIKTWINEADPDGPFFLGAEFSMVDVALAPWAVRLWVFDHFKSGGLGIPDAAAAAAATASANKDGEDAKTWNRWQKWVDAVKNRPSMVETMSDHEHYLPIYKRYADDEAQSEMAKASRSGRGVP